jgi:hypothetical protein
MAVLRIEHPVSDYDAWKALFDKDPIDRSGSGVRRYAVLRPVDDRAYVCIDLEFDDAGSAQSFLKRLESDVWTNPAATDVMTDRPRARVLETAETG